MTQEIDPRVERYARAMYPHTFEMVPSCRETAIRVAQRAIAFADAERGEGFDTQQSVQWELAKMEARREEHDKRIKRESSILYMSWMIWRALTGQKPKREVCPHEVLWEDCPDCRH
ncbi:MAG: hypothetical protein V4773_28130 [Verrucomicrobiota bacterium]